MAAPPLALDHLAIVAARLDQGVAYVEQRLGVRVPAGGRHPIMNTHNAVMSLGDETYLEIIAADPEAGPPLRPRWFGLDAPATQRRLADDGPFLATWVARSTDLEATLGYATVDIGKASPMSRGALHWKIALRDDGAMPLDGLYPTLIEWPPGPHVSSLMQDLGVRLVRLSIRAPAPRVLETALAAIGALDLIDIEDAVDGRAALKATLSRPDGKRVTLTG